MKQTNKRRKNKREKKLVLGQASLSSVFNPAINQQETRYHNETSEKPALNIFYSFLTVCNAQRRICNTQRSINNGQQVDSLSILLDKLIFAYIVIKTKLHLDTPTFTNSNGLCPNQQRLALSTSLLKTFACFFTLLGSVRF